MFITDSLKVMLKSALFYTHPYFLQSIVGMSKYKNRYLNETCYIIGNGPSLRHTNLGLLRDQYTFGLNRIYLLFPTMGFHTTFYVCVNQLVLQQFADDIVSLAMPKFLSWQARSHLPRSSSNHTYWLDNRGAPRMPRFASNPYGMQGIWYGTTVTYTALQIAYYMGFSKVVLVGVDHDFATKGEPHKIMTTDSAGDPNHFSSDYFGTGIKWQLPDLATSELAYRLAAYYYGLDGRQILDATVEGRLDVFPKTTLENVIHGS